MPVDPREPLSDEQIKKLGIPVEEISYRDLQLAPLLAQNKIARLEAELAEAKKMPESVRELLSYIANDFDETGDPRIELNELKAAVERHYEEQS